jgi:peroxiredoxin
MRRIGFHVPINLHDKNMNILNVFAIALTWIAIFNLAWLGWQLLRQNGRLLLRLEELENRRDEFEFNDSEPPPNDGESTGGRVGRFSNRSLTRSKIKRDGLETGTAAPDFWLPRLDGGGELSLSELHGKPVLLVFSDPHCGPCNVLAPELEKFHRRHPQLQLVMISKGEPAENRAKVKEHGLTFPVVLQQQWEISRRYAMFATPIAYLVNEQGIVAEDVAVGVEPTLALIARAGREASEKALALR